MNVTNGKIRKIPLNDNVDLIVRTVSITDAGTHPVTVEAVELREFLKNAEVEGHGVFIPLEAVTNILDAIDFVVIK